MINSKKQNVSEKIILAADLGGTNLRMAVINYDGKILYRSKRATPTSKKAKAVVQAIVESAMKCQHSSIQHGKVSAIVMAVPGTVNVKKGIIMTSPNLPALSNVHIASILENELDLPCLLENDANAAAVGENWLGASKGVQNSICITLGTGVGGGIIIDGKVLRGADGMAAEIGHLCVEAFGAPCRCGSRGCVEQYSSASAIVRIVEELKAEHAESPLRNKPQLNAFEVFQAGTNGDELALKVFRQMGFYLGVAITSLLNILNPEIIVIGGGATAF